MNPDLTALAAAFLHWLHERERQHDDPVSVRQFEHAYRRLTEAAQQADRTTLDQLLQALAAGFKPEQSNWEFGCLANTCGMIVEWGGDPVLALEPILDRISLQFAQVRHFVEIMQQHMGVEHPNQVAEQDWPNLGEKHPEHAWVIGEWYALRFTGCAAMTMLARDIGARQRARQRVDLVLQAESARSDNPFAYYLAELLGLADGERLLVLDTTRQFGFRVRLTAIRNNFHLFTLLQEALLTHPSAHGWQGPPVRPLLTAIAKGERLLPDVSVGEWATVDPLNTGTAQDTALWTYSTHLALRTDGTLAGHDSTKEGLPNWVWGEAKPTEIPVLAGERIVLLGPLQVPRSWDVAFFAPLHRALRSSAVVEQMLSAEDYLAWMGKIKDRIV